MTGLYQPPHSFLAHASRASSKGKNVKSTISPTQCEFFHFCSFASPALPAERTKMQNCAFVNFLAVLTHSHTFSHSACASEACLAQFFFVAGHSSSIFNDLWATLPHPLPMPAAPAKCKMYVFARTICMSSVSKCQPKVQKCKNCTFVLLQIRFVLTTPSFFYPCQP